jgi:hypothetical protein
MADYRVLSLDDIGGKVTVHGVAFGLDDVPWASRQLWAPDCGCKDGKYYFYCEIPHPSALRSPQS